MELHPDFPCISTLTLNRGALGEHSEEAANIAVGEVCENAAIVWEDNGTGGWVQKIALHPDSAATADSGTPGQLQAELAETLESLLSSRFP